MESSHCDYLSGLTGLPRGDYEVIDIAEFTRLICYIVARVDDLKGFILRYLGDKRNVETWARYRRPGNRSAQYSARVLNRLGDEFGFASAPCIYILVEQ